MNAVITGGGGRLGRELVRVFPDAIAPGREELDILDGKKIQSFFKKHRPDVLIHAAAYTSVSEAETEKDLCWKTNVGGTEFLVHALKSTNPNCYFVYISTACVFYGDRGMYSEDDIPHPKNFYGLTKLVGEYVSRQMENYLIIRTNFVERSGWPYPRAFSDRFGTYLYADDVAKALHSLISKKTQGLVHVAGDKKMSILELARILSPDIQPMTMADTRDPLTVDMSLTSKRISPSKLGSVSV